MRHVHKSNTTYSKQRRQDYIKVQWSINRFPCVHRDYLVIQLGLERKLYSSQNIICNNVTCSRSLHWVVDMPLCGVFCQQTIMKISSELSKLIIFNILTLILRPRSTSCKLMCDKYSNIFYRILDIGIQILKIIKMNIFGYSKKLPYNIEIFHYLNIYTNVAFCTH